MPSCSYTEIFFGYSHRTEAAAEQNLAGLWIRIHFFQIRIQYGSRTLMTKNWKKITAEKKFIFFGSKTAIYLSLGLHKVCPSYRRSLQFSKEAIQHFKTWTFTNYCLRLWVIFALLDSDPDSEYGSGSTDPIEYGSNTDPDPQPWFGCCHAVLKFEHRA